MPSCRPEVIPSIVYKVMEMRPQTILDVGAGNGKWVLCDEYLKYWCNVQPEIDGVEVFGDYESPAYSVYREVFNCNVMDLVKNDKIEEYDLVLIVDVIEHLTKEEGMLLLSKCNKYIVSTPNYWLPQGAEFDNEHERHISKWETSDFEQAQVVSGKYIMGWKP